MTGKLYYPDGASYQAGMSLAGWLAAMFKATEGTGYMNPYYQAQQAEAARRGAKQGAYHFLHAGNGSAQADHCFAVAGGVPGMLDMEPTLAAIRAVMPPPHSGRARPMGLEDQHVARIERVSDAPRALASNPTVADAVTFIDRYRARGGILHLLYLPWWYWVQLGQPSLAPLAQRGMHLVTSNYSGGSPEDPAHPGWVSYGGMPPVFTLQYTSAGTVNGMPNVDLNCFRGSGTKDTPGTLAELWSLWTTGTLGGTTRFPVTALPPGKWKAPVRITDGTWHATSDDGAHWTPTAPGA